MIQKAYKYRICPRYRLRNGIIVVREREGYSQYIIVSTPENIEKKREHLSMNDNENEGVWKYGDQILLCESHRGHDIGGMWGKNYDIVEEIKDGEFYISHNLFEDISIKLKY